MKITVQDYYRILMKIENKEKLTEDEKLIRNEIVERPQFHKMKTEIKELKEERERRELQDITKWEPLYEDLKNYKQKIFQILNYMCVACLQDYYEKEMNGEHIISRKVLLQKIRDKYTKE